MKPEITAHIIRSVSVISTLLTAFELTKDFTSSIVFFLLSVAAIVISSVYLAKSKNNPSAAVLENSFTAIVSAVLVWGCIGYNHWNDRTQKIRYSLWNETVSSRVEVDKLKQLADAGDGPALLEIAERYQKQSEYGLAREYYLRSALKGSSDAYLSLANMSIKGLGSPVDYPTAVRYVIEAHRRGSFDSREYINKLEDLGYDFSESETRSLNRWEDYDVDFLWILYESKGLKSLLKHREWLLKASDDGFLPATRALYVAEKETGADSTYVARLARLLYDAGITPTDEIERVRFMRYLGRDVSVSEQRYETLENERIFPLSYWDEERVEGFSSANDSSRG